MDKPASMEKTNGSPEKTSKDEINPDVGAERNDSEPRPRTFVEYRTIRRRASHLLFAIAFLNLALALKDMTFAVMDLMKAANLDGKTRVSELRSSDLHAEFVTPDIEFSILYNFFRQLIYTVLSWIALTLLAIIRSVNSEKSCSLAYLLVGSMIGIAVLGVMSLSSDQWVTKSMKRRFFRVMQQHQEYYAKHNSENIGSPTNKLLNKLFQIPD